MVLNIGYPITDIQENILYHRSAREHLREVERIWNYFNLINRELQKERYKRGIYTNAEKRDNLLSQVGVSKLGWVNCDRFAQWDESLLVDVKIPCKAAQKVEVFVALPNENALVKLKQDENSDFCSAYNGLPADSPVKLVAMSIEPSSKKLHSFVYEGKVRDLNAIEIRLNPTEIKQLQPQLGAL